MTWLFKRKKNVSFSTFKWLRTVVKPAHRSIHVADHPRAHYGQTQSMFKVTWRVYKVEISILRTVACDSNHPPLYNSVWVAHLILRLSRETRTSTPSSWRHWWCRRRRFCESDCRFRETTHHFFDWARNAQAPMSEAPRARKSSLEKCYFYCTTVIVIKSTNYDHVWFCMGLSLFWLDHLEQELATFCRICRLCIYF